MSLWDSLGNALGGAIGGALKDALAQASAQALPGLLQSVLAKTDLGGLAGILAQLQQGGLGDQVKSWLGQGANMHVTPDQLKAALGNDQVRQIAAQLGLPVDGALDVLARYLPTAVDTASPQGVLEAPPAAG